MYTFHFALFKIRYTLDRLTPVSREHCFTDFCGERVNCCNTAAEVARVVAVRGRPDLYLCAHHQQCRRFRIYPEYAQLLDVLGAVLQTVRRVGGCVTNC